jgi:uncharacterized protein YjbI with pentapeptide repeats
MHRLPSAFLIACSMVTAVAAADQASLSEADVRSAVHAGKPANFAHKRLFQLDLDGLDLRHANFRGANLLESSLLGADLRGADFTSAYLAATKFARANMEHAILHGATLLSTAENVDLRAADLSNTSGYLIAPHGNLHGANLSHAKLSPDLSNQPMGLLHTILTSADLGRANLAGADLSFSDMSFADLRGANVRGARFEQADLGRADFTGADVTGADFAKADLDGTIFKGVHGRAAMRGLATAKNLDRAVFH